MSEKVVQLYPDSCHGYRIHADVLKSMGKYGEAFDIMKKVSGLRSEEPADYYGLSLWGLSFGANLEVQGWSRTATEKYVF